MLFLKRHSGTTEFLGPHWVGRGSSRMRCLVFWVLLMCDAPLLRYGLGNVYPNNEKAHWDLESLPCTLKNKWQLFNMMHGKGVICKNFDHEYKTNEYMTTWHSQGSHNIGYQSNILTRWITKHLWIVYTCQLLQLMQCVSCKYTVTSSY